MADAPEGQRLDAMVSGAHRQWPRRHPQDHDRGAGPQASDRAGALCDDGRAARRRRADGEGDLLTAATMIPAPNGGGPSSSEVRRPSAEPVRPANDPERAAPVAPP